MSGDTSLDVATDHIKRVFQDQLDSIDGLSTKASVILGFVLTAFGALFGLNSESVHAHLLAALISAGLLISSSVLLARSYLVTEYNDPPKPSQLLNHLNVSPDELKKQMVAYLAKAYRENDKVIARRFGFLNYALMLFLAGVFVFVAGVVFA